MSGHFVEAHSRATIAPIKEGVPSGKTGVCLRMARSRGKPREAPFLPAEPFEHVHRLRKWSRAGFPLLRDHEVIEMVLGSVALHKNTNLIARTLLKNFRTFGRVVSASASALMAIEGMTEAGTVALKTVGQAALHMLRNSAVDRARIQSLEDLASYLIARLQHERVEVTLVIFMDSGSRVIAEEEIDRGTVNRVAFYPREIIRRCLELDATGAVLVHNHPGGTLKPSQADMELTRELVEAAEMMDICLVDHIIVAGGGYFSFVQENILINPPGFDT
jgi:DNA repair protein RadC